MQAGNRVYRAGEYLDIDGPLDPALFERALRHVVAQVDSLRVRFVDGMDGPSQVVETFSDWPLHLVDVSQEPDPLAAGKAWMASEVDRGMDLARGPLFTYALIKLGAAHFLWYQGYHHIVMDWVGIALVARRGAGTYTPLAEGHGLDEHASGSLEQLVDSDVAYRASEQFARDRDYWMRLLG